MSSPVSAPDGLTSSVAMCTYNGAKYLGAQLESLLSQTRLPQEIVICDDQSSDATPEVVSAISRRSTVPIRFLVNTERLGSTRNFERAMSLCVGDIIFFSDQDDVWADNKLDTIWRHFRDKPEVSLVFSDATLVDADLRPLGRTMWESIGFAGKRLESFRSGRAFDVQVEDNVVTGATMAIRSSFRSLVTPIPANWVHDAWISTVLSAMAPLVALPEPLIYYRQHPEQQIGATTKSWLRLVAGQIRDRQLRRDQTGEQHARQLLQTDQILERLEAQRLGTDEQSQLLKSKKAHFEARIGILSNARSRTRVIASELLSGRYARFSGGLLSAVKDLVI